MSASDRRRDRRVAGWRVAFGALGGLWLVALLACSPGPASLYGAQPVGLQAPRRAAAQSWRCGPGCGGDVPRRCSATSPHYTYVSRLLQDLSGIGAQLVGPLLFGFGLAGDRGTTSARRRGGAPAAYADGARHRHRPDADRAALPLAGNGPRRDRALLAVCSLAVRLGSR
ncbi:hypothetical protein [Nonomuraea rubra]|uniref:hypothetical protein n=1 Tax=Nonomuraea rubra TaxID=46180 RepID=UPI0031E6BD74